MIEESRSNRCIFVAGANGMVGSAIARIVGADDNATILTPTRKELDLTSFVQVEKYFTNNRITDVYLAAAKVGGIHANSVYPADFIGENLTIQSNVIGTAHKTGVEKLLFLGSSCIYPKFAEQPIREASLLTGALESTNEAYAIAKIAGLKLCEYYSKQYGVDYRSVMPCNLYGPNDNFHEKNSHVIPALIRKLHSAKVNDVEQISVWGTGKALREFLHVDDMASACAYVMNMTKEEYSEATGDVSFLNVGAGRDLSIHDLVTMLVDVVEYRGEIVFDSTKPDGTPRKVLDVSRLTSAGWVAGTGLRDGLRSTYKWYVENISEARI